MIDQLQIRPSEFADIGPVGFGVLYLERDEAAPLVGLLAVDNATDEETDHEIRPGQPFRVAGQTWEVAEVRYPADADWEVVLRRVPDGAE